MRITMVGTGYVGLVTGTCFANTGNSVTCLDIDQKKIEKLHRGESPIYEPGLDELIKRNVKAGRLHFTIDKQAAYQSAEIIFVCVGTPSDEMGRADLKYILAAARDIGEAIEAAPPDKTDRRAKIIIIKSTVPVGTNAMVKKEIASRTARPFRMASNPEFLKEGAAIRDFNYPDRVVIGVEDKGTADRLRDLYDPFVRQGNPIFVMDIPSAEMVKYAANAMLATKISFINEIANLCESYGADIDEVRRGMCSDKRIGNQFLYPGLGYGGSCFPKDVLAVISMGNQSSTPIALLQSVHDVNQRQRDAFMAKIDRHFGGSANLTGKRVAIWGIAFKPGTDDVREAPSITLMKHLLDRNATVVAFDPVAHETCRHMLGSKIDYAKDPMSALDAADALIICTDWDEFRHPDFEAMRARMKSPVIFDGRNLYRLDSMKDHGFVYHSIGRAPVSGKGE
ncbi:MAG: UDP-glucose/GDP-mannose dehydrogenase family protein [Planctomycetes bacterium]|nr:UDP-glucose/GDP-mannose dehydrogenase family protein [Planctomycetota bacterium]